MRDINISNKNCILLVSYAITICTVKNQHLFTGLILSIHFYSCLVVDISFFHFIRTRVWMFIVIILVFCILILRKEKSRFGCVIFYISKTNIEPSCSICYLFFFFRFHLWRLRTFCKNVFEEKKNMAWLRSSFDFDLFRLQFHRISFVYFSCINKCLRIMYVRPLEIIIRLLFLTVIPSCGISMCMFAILYWVVLIVFPFCLLFGLKLLVFYAFEIYVEHDWKLHAILCSIYLVEKKKKKINYEFDDKKNWVEKIQDTENYNVVWQQIARLKF